MITPKNEPNSNPIQSQFQANIEGVKAKQSQSNPIFKDYGCRKLYEKSPNLGIYALSILPFRKYNMSISRNNLLRVPNKMNRSTENTRFWVWQGMRSRLSEDSRCSLTLPRLKTSRLNAESFY